MSKVVFDLNVDACCACHACSIACMDQNDSGRNPYRNAFEYEKNNPSGKFQCGYFSVSCFHCEDAPCVTACPTGCIQNDPETGLTLYDDAVCIGCRSCSMACPFGVPNYSDDGKMCKCDGCIERLRHGMEPACVRVCPTKALQCYGEEEYQKKQHERTLRTLSRLLLE